ncbi:MAG TPA: hypothetical protein VEK57_30910 [Thermoanaerobaculia bacterium]|nr:hypothetical protein [Thermoanaerobaculia bacterium]
MAVTPTSCSTFVQIWVDSTAVQEGTTNGVYLVDNMLLHGSTNEGTPNLTTQLTLNSNICWSLLNVDPNSTTVLSFQEFGNSNAYGPDGTPKPFNSTNYTGQVQNVGASSYSIKFNVLPASGNGITVTVSPSFNVVAAQ